MSSPATLRGWRGALSYSAWTAWTMTSPVSKRRHAPGPGPNAQAAMAALEAAGRALAREDFDEAGRQFEVVARFEPRNPDLLANLGAVRARQGRLDDAVAALERALAVRPGHEIATRNLASTLTGRGNRHLSAGDTQAGVADLRRAIELDPSAAEAESALGLGLLELGRPGEALAHLARARERLPKHTPTLNRLGLALKRVGKFSEARQVLEAAAAIAPDLQVMVNLSGVCFELSQMSEAHAWAARAVNEHPGSPEAHNNLGLVLREQGDVAGGLAHFEAACALAPQGWLWQSGRLLSLNYLAEVDAAALGAAHRTVGEAWVASVAGQRRLEPRHPHPDRRLAIGYVSPDFRRHSVGYFVESFLGEHDPAAVEITCYASSPVRDQVTTRLQAMVPRWRDVAGLSDRACQELMVADGIDVLVDLAGHTSHNRLAVFARRAAPVQMTYLGYGVTTGLPTMDYLLTDEVADPPDQPGSGSESPLYLPGGYLSYRPPFGVTDGPSVAPLPARASGHVTFGSFNNLAKISDAVIDLWARLLLRVPGARMLVKGRGLGAPQARARLEARFTARDVDPGRVDLAPPISGVADHLALYGSVDIALDTYPYNGTTTTCEALWMGVPVVTLAGKTHMSRVSHSILARVSADELVAFDGEGYLRIAAALATDLDRLEALRHQLRQRMLGSPLMDGRRLARALEGAYRLAWRRAL